MTMINLHHKLRIRVLILLALMNCEFTSPIKSFAESNVSSDDMAFLFEKRPFCHILSVDSAGADSQGIALYIVKLDIPEDDSCQEYSCREDSCQRDNSKGEVYLVRKSSQTTTNQLFAKLDLSVCHAL